MYSGDSVLLPPSNLRDAEYVNNLTLNKSLIKMYKNYNSLLSLLNYRLTGNLNPVTNIITSGDIKPLTLEEKQLVNTLFGSSCYVNVNEKVTPQILNRVYQCLYTISSNVNYITQVKIANFNDIIQSINIVPPVPLSKPTATPTLTPTPTPTATPPPTLTPTQTPTLTFTPTPTQTVTPTHTPTQTLTQTPTLTPSSGACSAWQFKSTVGAVVLTTNNCAGASVTATLKDGDVVCLQPGATPSTGTGYYWINLGHCTGYYPGSPSFPIGPLNPGNQLA
jgi:hypothetical protein